MVAESRHSKVPVTASVPKCQSARNRAGRSERIMRAWRSSRVSSCAVNWTRLGSLIGPSGDGSDTTGATAPSPGWRLAYTARLPSVTRPRGPPESKVRYTPLGSTHILVTWRRYGRESQAGPAGRREGAGHDRAHGRSLLHHDPRRHGGGGDQARAAGRRRFLPRHGRRQ